MTTGWGEAFSNATRLEGDGDTPAHDHTAIDAGFASDAFTAPASGEAACLYGRLPDWPEATIYVYI
ncbi:MAG: hypothetical protein EON93_05875 [Burkholderiales bacterium]|nr:MAG: hypothetical protein EON93_05875 [Burkholderiales bacterium]